MKNKIKKIGSFSDILNTYGVLIALLLLMAVISIFEPTFFNWRNLLNILRQIAIPALIAFGMTYVILIGGIDLSVGSVLAVSGLVAITLANNGLHPLFVLLVVLILGLLFGAINGIIVTGLSIAPFVATLATMTIFRGFCYIATEGRPIRLEAQNPFAEVGAGSIFGLPILVWILILSFLFAFIVLSCTKFGRHVYITGGNAESAHFSGINVKKVTVIIFMISGMFAALSGAALASRLNSGQPSAGLGYELDAIAAAVLGGTNISGGYGKIQGTLLGAIMLGVLSNGMNLLQINSYWQSIATGTIILLAILFNTNRVKSAK